ncbi:MAG: N-acetylglucosamine-6-phosphate deacetylase, partial [Clostridia bacterium]|nr:N-acetylglucosamine-6-phosphate deacetylase [Clostridia bacterium]
MMKCIINGQLILPTEVVSGMAIIFDEKIEKIVPQSEVDLSAYEIIDAEGKWVAPGLVDIHSHGYMGADTSDGDPDGIRKMSAGLAKNGVTSFCPTTMTVSTEEIEKAFNDAREVKAEGAKNGAKVVGINCEGPFINESKKGAQAAEHIKRPDAEFIKKHADIIKVYTIAPEVDGGLECIADVFSDGRAVSSMGHTNASFDEANEGIAAGVRHTTHLFNAQTALMHRNPGVVGAALSDENVSVELICDTFHVNPGLYKMVHKLKGDKLCIITDCMRAGGMPDG